MKIRVLTVLFLFAVNFSSAQYCGNAGSNICSANNTFTSPGISDYNTFPCVHNNTNYNQVVQVLFPDSVFEANLWIPVMSVTIDSISNLPCGLCWSCDNSSFVYAGGSRACLLISGVADDAVGAYQINMYGTAQTPFGPFSGSLDNLGFQFFLNVVPQNAGCSPINILNLNTACSQSQPAPVNCNFNIQLTSSHPVANCHFDSTTLTVVQPAGPGYKYYWTVFPDSITGPFNITVDSGQSFQLIGTSSVISLNIVDTTTGCSNYAPLDFNASTGFFHIPAVCYATCDSSQAQNKGITLVFEKDDWFNNIANYSIYRQDSLYQTPLLKIGEIQGSAVGKIVDTFPRTQGINTTLNGMPFYTNLYAISAVTTCGDQDMNYSWFQPSILTVDTMSSGLPQLFWNNSNPLTYNGVYIFSRYPGGSWRLRFSSITLSDTSWVDQTPDSSQMEYMLGYTLTVNCDPNRSANMSFSNFGGTNVSPQHVVPDTTHTITTASQILVRNTDVLLYPNPTTNKLYLQLADVKNINTLSYKMYDVLGQLVNSGSLNVTQRQDLDVSNLSAGIYSVSILADKQLPAVRMFVKQ